MCPSRSAGVLRGHINVPFACKELNPKCQTSQHDKLIQPAFAPIDQLKSTIGISTTDPLVLCQKCYNDLYQLFHPSTICRSCRATPKAGTS